jgi:dihydrofolate synthase/folylpolyglutamate synthase
MNYSEAREFCRSALTFGIRLGLERMYALLALLDHPEKTLKVIHIAGTNGKGSTTLFCASILAADNQKVGVYTSPYIERFTERIRIIDGQAGLEQLARDESAGEISPADFAQIMTAIQSAVEQMLESGDEHPTEFELITAAALTYFHNQGCDRVVLETGLGGRLDSTKVIDQPERVIITALGFDHMDRLGYTLPAIAAEKAGIIKAGCPVFLYDPRFACPKQPDEAADALALIEQRCQELNAPLTILGPPDVTTLRYQLDGQQFRFKGTFYETRLLGLFQPLNAALAILACQDLVNPCVASPDPVQTGIAATRWPVRLEVIPGPPLTLIDGAHNPQGCQALGDALDRLLPGQPIVFLLGLLADKDYPAMLEALWHNRQFSVQSIVCVTPDNPRALPADQLADFIRADLDRNSLDGPASGAFRINQPDASTVFELKRRSTSGYNSPDIVRSMNEPDQGMALALSIATTESAALCVFGSLYLVGRLRSWIRGTGRMTREDLFS